MECQIKKLVLGKLVSFTSWTLLEGENYIRLLVGGMNEQTNGLHLLLLAGRKSKKLRSFGIHA